MKNERAKHRRERTICWRTDHKITTSCNLQQIQQHGQFTVPAAGILATTTTATTYRSYKIDRIMGDLKPGQKFPTPTPGFGDRVFYETLLRQRPESAMAQEW